MSGSHLPCRRGQRYLPRRAPPRPTRGREGGGQCASHVLNGDDLIWHASAPLSHWLILRSALQVDDPRTTRATGEGSTGTCEADDITHVFFLLWGAGGVRVTGVATGVRSRGVLFSVRVLYHRHPDPWDYAGTCKIRGGQQSRAGQGRA